MSLELPTPLRFVPGVGPRRAETLAGAGLETLEDLLWRLPFRYEDRSQLRTLASMEPGVPASVRVTVERTRRVPTRRRGFTLVESSVRDASGTAKLVFFNQPYLLDTLVAGKEIWLYGLPSRDRLFLEFQNPQIEAVEPEGGDGSVSARDRPGAVPSIHTGRIVPVYERIGPLGPRVLRTLVRRVLDGLEGRIAENLPREVLEEQDLPGREEAFREAHFPTSLGTGSGAAPSPATRRLAFEELFAEQLGLQFSRLELRRTRSTKALRVDGALLERAVHSLPFRLTGAQERVLREITGDLGRPAAMRRLLQGDVGAGKTAVAAVCLMLAAWNGRQGVLMAPTELLAEQHAATLARLLEGTDLKVTLLAGGPRTRARRATLEAIGSGEAPVVVGTHALLQEPVRFRDLALAVIDEQHRFGVLQRERLGAKGEAPHTLVMTATPIPRSLTLTAYGDLDLSVLDELPPGRLPVRTVIKTAGSEAETYGFLRREVERGGQAYVVCPTVEETGGWDRKAVEAWAEQVAAGYLRGLSVGLVHGRMKAQERARLMGLFAAGDVQVLVATTVVEVGIDVPNATVMCIEHAECFGLSQLHQLRGRVGRGRRPSTCILMVRSAVSPTGRERLEVLRSTSDGFAIAEADLRIRGPGEIFGTRQWGVPVFRVANLLRDFGLLEAARRHAARLAADPAWMRSPAGRAFLACFDRRYRLAGVG